MKKCFQTILFSTIYLVIFLTSPLILLAHAQLNGCGEIDIGNPGSDQQPPPQCQTQSVSCNNVIEINNISYTDSNNHSVSASVWNCNHKAPLVVFIPGQSRSADDYARYEKAIAADGFTVAGINFGNENDGNHFSEEVTDTKFLIGKLEGDSKLNIQPGKVGLVGHSDGGIVSSMEGYQGNNDPSIRAIISEDGFASGRSGGPPLLLVHGSNDIKYSSPPNLNAYTADPKYHAEIIGADHFCYVAEISVPRYPIDCATAGLQQQTQVLDAITAAFLQNELLGCGDSLSNVANQYQGLITLQQSGNTTSKPCSLGIGSGKWPFLKKDPSTFRRADQGWDLQGASPQVIYAVAAGKVYKANNDPSGFGDFYPYENLDSPITVSGRTYTDIYYGHVHYADGTNGTPHNVLGTHVNAGDPVAYTYPGCCWPANWLEIGFGNSAPVGHGPFPTQAGLDMEQYLNGTRNAY